VAAPHEIVDEEKGSCSRSRCSSTAAVPVRSGSKRPGVDSLPLGGSASNLQAGEIFEIERGQIIAIEAMGRACRTAR
jgi:hypothetical protein